MAALPPASIASLPPDDRKAIGGLFASLLLTGGSDPEWARKTLEDLFDRLALPESDRSEAVGLAFRKPDPTSFASRIKDPAVKWMVIWDLLILALSDKNYDARERAGLRSVAAALDIPWERIREAEDGLAAEVRRTLEHTEKPSVTDPNRWFKIAGAAGLGLVGLAITGGLAAPAIGGAIGTYFLGLSGAAAVSAGLATLGGGALAAGGFGMAGGTAVVAVVAGAVGGSLAGYKASNLFGDLQEFRFDKFGGEGMHVVIGVSGFMSQDCSNVQAWEPLSKVLPRAEHYALTWESKHLLALGTGLSSFVASQVFKSGIKGAAASASRAAAGFFEWPAALLALATLIDNPWHVAVDRADKTAIELAKALASRSHGSRPVTLVGFSLGTRVIVGALEELAKQGQVGIVENAILLGGAVSANAERVATLKRVVAGQIVNGYSHADWVLAYLYRAAQADLRPIGLGPVEGFENYDLTEVAGGHLGYRAKLEEVLRQVGVDHV